MASFAAAYVLVLFAVVGYAGYLGVVQRRLARDLESLRSKRQPVSHVPGNISRAA